VKQSTKETLGLFGGILIIMVAAAFVMFTIKYASEDNDVPESYFNDTTTTEFTIPPPTSTTEVTTTTETEVQLAPNGPGTGSCVERLPSGEIVDCG